MKIKTSELEGRALDWAVAKCEGCILYMDALLDGHIKRGLWISGLSIDPNTWTPLAMFTPSSDWSQGGPIIERARLYIQPGPQWSAMLSMVNQPMLTRYYGPTPLIAAMRCYVSSKLGNEIDIPEELV